MSVYSSHPFHDLIRIGLKELSVHSSCNSHVASEEPRGQFAAFHRLAEQAVGVLEGERTISYASVSTGQKSRHTASSLEKVEAASSLIFLMKSKKVYLNGAVYQGVLGQDGLCIYGSVKYPDGSFYEGSLDQGIPHGLGCLIAIDGTVYEGLFYRGKLQGEGKMKRTDGSFYEGMFERGCPNGFGQLTHFNGDVYVGQFSEGYFHGFGRLVYSTRQMYYVGQFAKGVFHGPGRFVYANGSICKGFFEDGCLIGHAEMMTVPSQWYPDNLSQSN